MTRTVSPPLQHSRSVPAEPAGSQLAATKSEAEHNPHLAHHYDTADQQYGASKLGMWLFLSTELLFFGGLFVLYAVYRGNNPEVFSYGSKYMSTTLGMVNTFVLILSSMTMAFAVRYAQLRRRGALATMLGLTLLGGSVFMCIKYVEYEHKINDGLVWGLAFYDEPDTSGEAPSDDTPLLAEGPAAGDVDQGQSLWMNTCIACHGTSGQGVSGQAFDIRESEFIDSQSDDELLAFIKQGRTSFDPDNSTGIQMPPKGGNPMLSDDDLRDIVAYIRTFEMPEGSETDADAAADAGGETGTDEAGDSHTDKLDIRLMKSSIPPAAVGPSGLKAPHNGDAVTDTASDDEAARPSNAHLFFGIYYLMTGLHGIHVLIGMGLITWLFIGSLRGRFVDGYFTPIELTGLFWHLVDLIWIFLFPLLYLIH